MPAAEAFLFPDNLAALATCRELGKAGIRATVLGSRPGPAAYSRHSRFVRTPDLYAAPGDLVNAIVEHARTRAARPVLFPTEDAALLVADHFHERLADWLLLPHPAPGIVTRILDKRTLHETADRAGLASPRLVEPAVATDVAQLDALAADGAWLAKPPCRYLLEDGRRVRTFLEATGGAKAVAGDLRSSVAFVRRAGFPPILQEQVPGPFEELVSVGLAIDREGRVIRSFTARKRCEYPEPFGDGLIVEVIRDPGITEMAADLMREAGYWGICDVEFKCDPRDGRFKLLDANPRVWLWHGLGALVNAPMALSAYALATGEDLDDLTTRSRSFATDHPRWVSPRGAAAYMVSGYNPARHGLVLPLRLTLGALGTMLRNLLIFQDPLYLRPSAWRDILLAVLRRARVLPARSSAASH